MNESEINIGFKRKIKIVNDQNIFDSDLYCNCINVEIPLRVRLGYSVTMLDIYSELLEYFIFRNEDFSTVIQKGYESLGKKEDTHFNRIQYLELFKQKSELEFIKFMRNDIVAFENELKKLQSGGILEA